MLRQGYQQRLLKSIDPSAARESYRLADPSLTDLLCSILYRTDPNTFASLMLVSRAWRAASKTPHLYAYHLARCPSFTINNNPVFGPFGEASLLDLQRQFAYELKRNLFEVYLRPRKTTINLISTIPTSSAALPGGEAFDFTFSANGHWVLAWSSSRIFVIDTFSSKVSVQRELKVLRRPVAATMLDDGSILAVLSTDHQINIYDLSDLKVKHMKSVALDNPPHAIALSPKGEVIAAAYEGGIEVHSLAANALPTDRRAVKCDAVDALAFSSDGTMLLGTTQNSKHPNTVVLSAPYYTEGLEMPEETELISHIWTSQILFPNSSRDCSHAALLPHHLEGDASWTFTYDRVFESFRAVRTDDLRNGTTYFTGPKPPNTGGSRRCSSSRFVPCTLPATNDGGDLAAAGFFGKDIWVYGIPLNLDAAGSTPMDGSAPLIGNGGPNGGPSLSPTVGGSPATPVARGGTFETSDLPQWQVLIDKYRNVFARGRRVAEVQGVAGMRWVSQKGHRSIRERLVVIAPGGVSGTAELDQVDQVGFASVDGGRLVVLDFDRSIGDGSREEVTIEVGNVEPELLDEEKVDMATEVALVRRRTVIQRRDGLARAGVTSLRSAVPGLPSVPLAIPGLPLLDDSSSLDVPPSNRSSPGIGAPTEGLSLQEASEAFDAPYSHTQPRSRTSLYRASTAAAAERRRNPRVFSTEPIRFRRPDGRGEVPDESDADNWVPPPPPYTPDAETPLPEHFKLAISPRHTEPIQSSGSVPEQPLRSNTMPDDSAWNIAIRRRGSLRRPLSISRQLRSSVHAPSTRRDPLRSATTGARHPNQAANLSRMSGAPTSTEPGETPNPNAGTLNNPRLRPISAMVTATARSDTPSTAPPLPAIVAPEEAAKPPGQRRGQSLSLPSSPVRAGFPASRMSLSGSNLQRRLAYPVPPLPSLPLEVVNVSPPLQRGVSSPATLPVSELHEPGLANLPSAEQLAHLRNRYNRPPSPVISRPASAGRGSVRGRNSPAPPRGALGAAGNVSSTSVDRIQAPARALSRSVSRESARSYSASTPNLLRPSPQRLETIQSISSFLSHHRTRSGDMHVSQVAADMGRGMEEPPVAPEVESRRRRWRTVKKAKKSKGRVIDDRIDNRETPSPREEEEGKRKKGAKCVVM